MPGYPRAPPAHPTKNKKKTPTRHYVKKIFAIPCFAVGFVFFIFIFKKITFPTSDKILNMRGGPNNKKTGG
ncbi:hypothetical protein, partial [Enterobacter hormaechei]